MPKAAWPIRPDTHGIRSTGTKSIRFISNTHTKIVSANGAISALLPWKVLLTLSSTNSTTSSTNACILPGTPVVAFEATLLKIIRKRRPRPIDHASVSTCHAQKPAPEHALLKAIPLSVEHMVALVKWCLMYSEVVYSDAIV